MYKNIIKKSNSITFIIVLLAIISLYNLKDTIVFYNKKTEENKKK